MDSGTRGPVAPESSATWVDYIGIVLILLAAIGCIIVGIRIALGFMDGGPS